MTMRTLTDHITNGLNEAIEITVLDEPGSGGANHEYQLILFRGAQGEDNKVLSISFQNGPIKEAGFNGFTNEALLAVLLDRMRGFNEGSFRSRENSLAFTHLELGMMYLQKRTQDRLKRGVEGTHEK